MEENCQIRRWEQLLPDVLGHIFKNLSLREALTVVPSVCKPWEAAVAGSYCWVEIEIEEWSKSSNPTAVDRMIRLLVTRSSGSVRKLSVSLPSGESFRFIANGAPSLQTLKFRRSRIDDAIVEEAAPKLSSLTYLDLSQCANLGAPAISALGKSCKALTTFRREMDPFAFSSRDEEALSIAATMPKLKHLDIQFLPVETSSVIEILKSCKDLEFLDVRGCWRVALDVRLLKEYPKLEVLGTVVDGSDATGWDCPPSSGYLAWDFEAGESDEDFDGSDDGDDDDGDGGMVMFYDNANFGN